MQLTLANCSPFFKMDGEDPLKPQAMQAYITAFMSGYQSPDWERREKVA